MTERRRRIAPQPPGCLRIRWSHFEIEDGKNQIRRRPGTYAGAVPFDANYDGFRFIFGTFGAALGVGRTLSLWNAGANGSALLSVSIVGVEGWASLGQYLRSEMVTPAKAALSTVTTASATAAKVNINFRLIVKLLIDRWWLCANRIGPRGQSSLCANHGLTHCGMFQ